MARRTPRHLERGEQANGVKLLQMIGAAVYVSGTNRPKPNPGCPVCLRNQSTRQTPGIPDVEAFLPNSRVTLRVPTLLKWECKAPGKGAEAMSVAQDVYRQMCDRTGVWHVVGDYTALMQALVSRGYLREQDVPFYRLVNHEP